MKDQQIDALALYKAYYRFLHEEPRDNAGDICETNPHRINIRHFENMVGIEKENFLGQYGYAKHIGAMAERMRVMVDDPRLGGHYEVMIDEQGEINPDRYAELCRQYREEMQKAARIYASILQYEEWINEELRAIDAERAAAALDKFVAMREVEGAKMKADVAGRAQTILDCVAFVEERSPQTVREYNEKLAARVHELLGDVTLDEGRLLQETAIFADKVAVAEETVRLRSHIAQLGKFLEAEEPIGRKMDFLVQEINREANTIGSKASDVAIAGKVIDIKAEVEKIREQIQNIE